MITEKEYEKALDTIAKYEKQLNDPDFIKVGDKVLIGDEYEDVVIRIDKAYKRELDYIYFKEGWTSRSVCKKIK